MAVVASSPGLYVCDRERGRETVRTNCICGRDVCRLPIASAVQRRVGALEIGTKYACMCNSVWLGVRVNPWAIERQAWSVLGLFPLSISGAPTEELLIASR
ncbi:hypothetical protein GOP47_0023121 [Adiantum capillus-veneris]|uniref:Uncharacterized protein n=1 Tax=Adiantum capillus-veneris TaxID=13818 RepID=A0A9D4U752_ADICA|nr:hypothetical protein GOP47_0023121 [Adiantum capillus-veneris]